MKKRNFATVAMSFAMAGMCLIGVSACQNNKYKNMSEISAAKDSADAADAEQVAPLTPNAPSRLTPELNKKYGAAFFENDANKADTPSADKWCQTASGLKYCIVEPGKGENPKAENEVTVHYIGMLTNGKEFDSSVSRGEPTSFPLTRVIPGWTEGLQLMKPGGIAVFYIPGNLAYGEQGQPQAGIEPNATLIFDVELLGVQ